ncbi:uncharacterized protein [Macrobrachium rosenbergii]|uniref:uncharacterized protein n=1 Tax=Macrobrachium rosenbergii TaxID=79674 RepID=UPI0034D698FC
MKTILFSLVSAIVLLTSGVRGAKSTDDDLFDVLANDGAIQQNNSKQNVLSNSNGNGFRNSSSSSNNFLNGAGDSSALLVGNGLEDSENQSMSDSSSSSSIGLFSDLGTTIATVTAVSILATLLLLYLTDYDFGSILGRLDATFGGSSFAAPNYPFDEGLENYPPPVILARRSYAALTPVIDAITSAYKKYHERY